MADPAESLIESIRLELNELVQNPAHHTVNDWSSERWGVGKLAKSQNHTNPRIDWEEIGGQFEDARISGGNGATIAVDAARYQVTIWHSSVENCRATLHNLFLASRHTSYGPNMAFGAYTFVEDASIKLGRKLSLVVTLRLPVSAEVVPTGEVTGDTHEVFVGTELVC